MLSAYSLPPKKVYYYYYILIFFSIIHFRLRNNFICLLQHSFHRFWAFREATYGTHFGRQWCDGQFRSGVSCHWVYHWVYPCFNPFRRGWLYRPAPEGPFLGPRHFWKCCGRVGLNPAPGPTLKKASCNTRYNEHIFILFNHLLIIMSNRYLIVILMKGLWIRCLYPL